MTLEEVQQFNKNIPDNIRKYLNKRGITDELIDKHQIGWSGNRIVIPVFSVKGNLLVVKLRKSPFDLNDKTPKYLFDTGGADIFGYDNLVGAERLYICEGECFHPDAEYLTPEGWVKSGEYINQKVAQYNKDGTISFVKPNAKIEKMFNGKLIEYSNAQKFYSLTTPKHNLVSEYKNNLFKKTAKVGFSSNYNIIRTALYDGMGLNLSNDEIKLCIAVSADFTIRKTGDIYGCFKKERKIKRIVDILNKLEIPFSNNKDGRGYNSIFIKSKNAPSYLFKEFPQKWIYRTSQKQKELIIDEVVYWDGNHVPNRNQIEYSSVIKKNIDFIQTIAHLCGYVSTIINRHNNKGHFWYKLSILFDKKYTSWQSLRNKQTHVPYNGKVYCVNVPSGMLIVRQKGCISISGNCDCILLQSKGVNAITSTAGANTFKKDWILECLQNIKEFYIVFDRDEAGDAGANKLAQNLLELLDKVKVYKVTLPEIVGENGDLTDYFVTHNGEVSDLMNKYASKVMLNLAEKTQNNLKPVFVNDFSGSFEDEIQAAKNYPMEALMPVPCVKTSNNILFYLSPFREEVAASFAVYKDTNSWYDFGDGSGGDTIAYIQKIYGLDFKESVKFIIKNA